MAADKLGLPEADVASIAGRLVQRHGSRATAIVDRFISQSDNNADRATWLAVSRVVADLIVSAH